MDHDEACRQVTAPGERFETDEVAIGGVTYTAFKHAPGSLRQVFDSARSRGDEVFLVYEDERWSFERVMQHVDALAALLVARGVGKGDRVSIGMRNYPEWVIAFAAITSIGATAETIVDGWLRSGDIGRLDAEGFVYVEDRAKDMVLRAGENVYCAEVEAAIYEHPDVYEAAVFGVPHERLGEEVACAVLPKAGSTLTAGGLRSFLGERLAAFKVPSVVRIVDDRLPRNPAGKILKRELRDSLSR